MILNNAPQNEAIVSNVAEIGEFRIRNSAKAFSILSSGLYANKIRAIIRELSCNAVDSHTAAGKTDTPFDVHLPNQLEPWFSIRDYGTGLSHEQVTQIYTTYFESTKTASNEFIGALGLGSKSPFAYTDNFTVTAVQDNKKGIYSAFINEAGVPSIALMMQEATDEPAGVEVKFSVNSAYDYDKFRQEARTVYTYFTLRPVVSGATGFAFNTEEYETRDIIPGVHSLKTSHRRSVAVMGNIAYPLDVPSSFDLGELSRLLSCGLEMHFAIGELDFQASREGLSYIPQTVEAIKTKLEKVNSALATVVADEAKAIKNLWDRAVFLDKKKQNNLWTAAVTLYATNTKLATFNDKFTGLAKFRLKVEDLATRYNIQIKAMTRSRHSKTVTTSKPTTEYGGKLATGHYETWAEWQFNVNDSCHFVINDLKTGAGERARYHYRETPCEAYQRYVYVLEQVDKTKPMKTDAFFRVIKSPPKDRIFRASALLKKERASVGRNVTIMCLQKRGHGGYYRQEEMVWRDAGKADSFAKNVTFYYVPLSGFIMQSSKGYTSGKELYDDVSSLPDLFKGTIYGVRKGDIDAIKTRKNWVNFEDHIASLLNGRNNTKLMMSLVRSSVDNLEVLEYTNYNIVPRIDDKSPYAKLVNEFKDVSKFTGNMANVTNLFKHFAPNANLSPEALINKYRAEAAEVNARYPLLKALNSYRTNAEHIAEYINLIDAKKGI